MLTTPTAESKKQIDQSTLEFFNEMSRVDKARYLREMQNYEPAVGHKREMPRIRDDFLESTKFGSGFKTSDEGSSKRKRTSYNAFIDQERFNLVNSTPVIGRRMVVQMSMVSSIVRLDFLTSNFFAYSSPHLANRLFATPPHY